MYPKKRCILLYPYKVVYHKLSRWFVEIKDASFSPRGSAAVWGLARGDESQQRKGVVEKPWKKQWVEPGRNRGNHPWHPEFFWWKKPGYLCAGKKTWKPWWRMVKNCYFTHEFCTDFIQHGGFFTMFNRWALLNHAFGVCLKWLSIP